MRRFGTQGRVYPDRHYVVPRTEEIADFIARVKDGRYIVLFAPRQTGKTTFFRMALEVLTTEDPTYFPIQLNFEEYEDCTSSEFYESFNKEICKEIRRVFQKRGERPSDSLSDFLDTAKITNHLTMREFFEQLSVFLYFTVNSQKVVLIIDEFDAIPKMAVRGFLHSLRYIYLSDELQCPYGVGIVGVKSISQLNYDRSVSPFNIQDEFRLPNFTLQQVQELLSQYMDEVGQAFAPEVIESIYKQTAGQPVLVNRFGQILTEEMDIPKTETITPIHFSSAHTQLLRGRNTNIQHLTTNIRRDRRFESMLMKIMAREAGVDFNLDDDIISELATYGVIKEAADGKCEIVNPIYLYRIIRTFKPTFNGLENEYLAEEKDECFLDYLTANGQIDMVSVLDNFRDFIARVGFRILQVPDKPREYVGQHLLYAYLEQFIRSVGGNMYLEVQTGRGRMDILLIHNQRKYIVETKIWEGKNRYATGKKQLAAYMELERTTEGYYVVFDHRDKPEPLVETETVDGATIRSYVISVIQTRPSSS